MAFRIRRKKNVNVVRVGVKIITAIIGLYASGLMLTVLGNVMINTSSPFYQGLTLIGWTVSTVNNGTTTACNTGAYTGTIYNCLTSTNGSGILAVVGLLAIVWVIFEFIDINGM